MSGIMLATEEQDRVPIVKKTKTGLGVTDL